LGIGRSALSAWRPIDFVESVHVQLTNKARKIVVFKVRPQYRPAKFTHIRHNEAGAKFRPRNEMR
jgi:hypothetical protein